MGTDWPPARAVHVLCGAGRMLLVVGVVLHAQVGVVVCRAVVPQFALYVVCALLPCVSRGGPRRVAAMAQSVWRMSVHVGRTN